MERALENYIEELKSDVASRVYSEGEGTSFEDKFTEYCIEVLESIGKSEGARVLSYIHPNSNGGIDWKINGFCLRDFVKDENNKEYYETLDLFITFYKNEYDYNITKEDYTKSLNQIKRFINSSLKRHIDYIDKANAELYHLVGTIGSQGQLFDRINVYFLINGFSNHDKEKIEIADADVFVHTWDVTRLFKINESNSIHEPIVIEFENFTENGNGLQCLYVPSIDILYDCYLAIVPGEILAKLYKEYSNELLESNVRAFLGQAGKFNKGIRETIRSKPQMFLPYNNGITATAENVVTKVINNQLVITKLNDFQIVNGGQTTASLYHTQKKFKDADLSKIFVQMKLTVIKDREQKNIEVPNISRYANSQNKVNEADFSSSNPFLIAIENLSRKKYVVNPKNRNQSLLWFFERTNGQYREMLNKRTVAQQRIFKEQNPTELKFSKTDVAKFINIWELEPYNVSMGKEKNFAKYILKVDKLSAKKNMPGDNFYCKLVANAILFKTADKLFGRKGVDAIGDTNLKAFTVAYSLSYFHFLTNNRLNLFKIYDEQKVDDYLSSYLKKLMIYVYEHIITEASGSLISEYVKRSSSWEKLKSVKYPENLMEVIKNYLITEDEKILREVEKQIDINNLEDTVFFISKIQKLGLNFWDGFQNYISQNKNEGFEFTDVFDLNKKIKESKNLSKRDIDFGIKVLNSLDSGFFNYDIIKSFSKLDDREIVEIKFIFDKLKEKENDFWNRIIDIGSQTKTFDSLELSNIKTIQMAFKKNDKIKEQSLLRAYESIQKLKKFNIHI